MPYGNDTILSAAISVLTNSHSYGTGIDYSFTAREDLPEKEFLIPADATSVNFLPGICFVGLAETNCLDPHAEIKNN